MGKAGAFHFPLAPPLKPDIKVPGPGPGPPHTPKRLPVNKGPPWLKSTALLPPPPEQPAPGESVGQPAELVEHAAEVLLELT